MKVTMEREEFLAALEETLNGKFGGSWECTSADYQIPRDLDFEQITPASIAKKAKEAAEMAALRAKWAEEEAAKAAIPECERTDDEIPL